MPCTSASRRRLLQAGAALAAGLALPAFAQGGYPDRAIRVLVPYPPGGNTDVIARDVMRRLSARLGQPVVVDNKPGANSILGTDLVAKAAPDGYTLLVVIGAYANNQSLYKKLPYTSKDLAPVSLLTRTSLVLITSRPDIKTVEDLVREGNKPGAQLQFASSGIGSAAHILGERFVRAAGIKSSLHVPYKGSTDAINDLVSGRIAFMFDAVSAMGPNIRAGKLTALAVTGKDRSPLLPEVPSLREAGYPALVSHAFAALLAPAQTPAPIVERLSREVAAVLADPELKTRLAAISTDPVGSTPAELASFPADEVKVNGEVIRQLGVTLD
ncbi:tripartite tricarboxylate transporter substrate binding protein [Ramlibacter terrae]|uniref:Tripartite tricarboxylate transporter substrate binding protein n=1 Tax=Ramlibacter terrae TaxID=2732511 RepID=A0ABX6P2C8_9BURK|nr:tripartite tricarboxylate transporter substrate binding protein [Ramlibacter terrae]